jgi:CubicO group peptidase (beta-lactamase class C family)
MTVRLVASFLAAWAAAGVVTADDLDRALVAEMSAQQVPGLTFAVVRGGQIARTGAYGYANLEWKAAATTDTRFEIASVSKMFTGAAARLLIEEGRLDPEAPVARYLDGMPDAWATMRVRHLLTMSTGLPDDWGGDLIPYDAEVATAYDDAAMLRAFTNLRPEAPIGAEFHYSSPGYAMLGMIVSRLSGQPLAQFVSSRVFAPAGMSRSTFIDNAAVVPERADGYRRSPDGLKRGWILGQYLHARPDTGILSTAPDLARWLIAVKGGRVVKDPEALWAGSSADSGRALDYSYGWSVQTLLGHRRIGHGGRYRTGFRAAVDFFPDDDLGVVVLANCDGADTEAFSQLIARRYVRDLDDAQAEMGKPDGDPAQTAAVIAAIKGLAGGHADPAAITPDALDPLSVSEAAEFLKHVDAIRFAGRRLLPGRGLTQHGHRLVEYVTLRLETGAQSHLLTAYRDDQGRIAFVEPTT